MHSFIVVSVGLTTGDLLTETGHLKNFIVQSCSCLGSELVVMRVRSRMTMKMRRRMSGSQRLSLGGMGAFFIPLYVLILLLALGRFSVPSQLPQHPLQSVD